ncbi:hypothetical protein ACOJQI_11565 [Bacillus salacetis]|uniref:hypothetical protein n=1 Tax=Bacillus salacetis TaxID=2315464 RepID=UPI003BA26BD3
MSKKRNEGPLPDEGFIQEEIKKILSKGMDSKASFWSYLGQMYKQVGFRFIFRDFAEIFFTLVIAIIAGISFLAGASETIFIREVNLYTMIFSWSPITYLMMAYLFFLIQKKKPTYEVEMTCKYNLHQLAAFRMLMFSVISLIMNGVIIFLLMLQAELNFFYAMLLSSSSLFLFSLLFLFVILRARNKFSKIGLFLVWVTGNIVASYFSGEYYLHVLKQIPFYIYALLATVGIVLYVKNLKRLLYSRNLKGLM